MSALVGYLALGFVDPANPLTFTELAFGGYARQPVAFDPDVSATATVDTGDPTLRLTNAVSFAAPALAASWPLVNAYGLYQAKTAGTPLLFTRLGSKSGGDRPNAPRTFNPRDLVLIARAGSLWESPLGQPVRLGVSLVYVPAAGGVQIPTGFTSLAGALPTS